MSGNIPRLPAKMVARELLTGRLETLAPVTIVHGPPGTGKTALVAAWAQQQTAEATVWWLTLDDQVVLHELSAVLNSRAQGKLIVVIDNAHHLTDRGQLAALFDQIQIISNAYLVFCSRNAFQLKSTALDRGISFVEIDGTDLSITQHEILGYAKAWGYSLGDSQAQELHQSIGGWLSPLRLSLRGTLREQSFLNIGAARRYCRETLLSQLDEEDLHALSLLSLSDELTKRLVAFLTGVEDSHRLIERLEFMGLLEPVPTSEDENKWRILPLARTILRGDLAEAFPEENRQTLKKMAWYYSQDIRSLGKAIRYGRMVNDWEMLAELWLEHGMNLAKAAPDDFHFAFHNLPSHCLEKHPVLRVAQYVAISLHAEEEEEYALRLEQISYHQRAHPAKTPFGDEKALYTALEMARLRSQNQFGSAQSLGAEFHREYESTSIGRKGRFSPLGIAWVNLEWGIASVLLDNGPAAERATLRAYSSAKAAGGGFLLQRSSAQLALMYAIDGSTDEARKWITTHDEHEVSQGWSHKEAKHFVALARAVMAIDLLDEDETYRQLGAIPTGATGGALWTYRIFVVGRAALAFGHVRAGLQQVTTLLRAYTDSSKPRPPLWSIIDRSLADLLLAQGEINLSQTYLNRVDKANTILGVPRARLALMTGNPGEARNISSSFPANSKTILRDRAEMLMIEAAAELAMENEEAAIQAFIAAHHLAHRIRTTWPYGAIPKTALSTLFEMAKVQPEEMLATTLAKNQQMYPSHGKLTTLTQREQVVLNKLEEYESATQIARVLVLSTNTIKKQIAAIYSKLGVHDRTAALARARRLGLLGQYSANEFDPPGLGYTKA